jgi:hypothetical protein
MPAVKKREKLTKKRFSVAKKIGNRAAYHRTNGRTRHHRGLQQAESMADSFAWHGSRHQCGSGGHGSGKNASQASI